MRLLLFLLILNAATASANSVDALRQQEKQARVTNIDAKHEDNLAVLQIKYQLALEKKYQQALEAGGRAIAEELKREQQSFAYDGFKIAEPKTPLLRSLRQAFQDSVAKIDTERETRLLAHYQNALTAAEKLANEADSPSATAYVRELELEIDALEGKSNTDSAEFFAWLEDQRITSRIDHLRFHKNGVMLADAEGRETRLAMWKYAPSKNTLFWRHNDMLQTLEIVQGNGSALYQEDFDQEYRLYVEPLPKGETWRELIVGDWARLFWQGTVRRRSFFKLSFAADGTALYGDYDPKLAGNWKLEENLLQIDYEDGTRDVITLLQDDLRAFSVKGTHYDGDRKWTFTLVRLIY